MNWKQILLSTSEVKARLREAFPGPHPLCAFYEVGDSALRPAAADPAVDFASGMPHPSEIGLLPLASDPEGCSALILWMRREEPLSYSGTGIDQVILHMQNGRYRAEYWLPADLSDDKGNARAAPFAVETGAGPRLVLTVPAAGSIAVLIRQTSR